jgi:hypothetical protein
VENEVSPEVCDFIARHIASVEELEILLILQEQRDREWTAREINERLRSQEVSIKKWLDALVSSRLAVRTETGFRFAPSTEELARHVAALVVAYRERRIKVIELIFAKPNENLLNFVRAFDFRNPP